MATIDEHTYIYLDIVLTPKAHYFLTKDPSGSSPTLNSQLQQPLHSTLVNRPSLFGSKRKINHYNKSPIA